MSLLGANCRLGRCTLGEGWGHIVARPEILAEMEAFEGASQHQVRPVEALELIEHSFGGGASGVIGRGGGGALHL